MRIRRREHSRDKCSDEIVGQHTYIGSVGELRVARHAGLNDIHGQANCPEGSHQLLVHDGAKCAAHLRTDTRQVSQRLAVEERQKRGMCIHIK